MTEESCPAARAPEWVLAALLCMAGALLVLWDPLVGDTCTLSFDDTHPGYPAPWVQPDGGPWPLINPITPDGDFLALPGTMRLAQLEEAGLDPWWGRALSVRPAGPPDPTLEDLYRAAYRRDARAAGRTGVRG